ncbi:MAG TPA: hypothetical protein PLJ08_23665, partial [Cyclobacteriaceae bacterium]|nr:hypothetical protein [Cyclobacteriaceae bacterium]
ISKGLNANHVGYFSHGIILQLLQAIDLSGIRKWVVGRHTLGQLTQLSGYSIRTLKRHFHCYLNEPPVLSVYPSGDLSWR